MAITNELKCAVSYESSAYRRCKKNILFNLIDEDLVSYFGPIVIMIKGSIMVNHLLYDLYIRDFVSHRCEKQLINNLDKFYGPDINFYSDIKKWVDGHSNIIMGVLGISDEIYPFKWPDPYYPRVLCGPKGCGKTTHMLFTKAKVEDASDMTSTCIYIRLPTRTFGDSKAPDIYIVDELIHKIDNIILENCEKKSIDQDKMNLLRFEPLWKHLSLYEEETDSKEEKLYKRHKRGDYLSKMHQYKYAHEFENYMAYSFNFIEKYLNIRVIVMIDDVDRLDSLEIAQKIVDNTKALARKLGNVPIILSAREETVALLHDADVYAYKIPIIPPSFINVMNKRRDRFIKTFKLNEDKFGIALSNGINDEKIKDYIDLLVDSFLKDPTYSRLVSFHYDLDILLDIFRCVATSPFISHDYMDRLIQDKKTIPWNIILDSMQRYHYQNFYQENSFVLNMFDNNERPSSYKNSLVRIRLLQVLRHRFKGVNEPVSTRVIYDDMCNLGYNRKRVASALKPFANQRLIATGKANNRFEERNTFHIIPQRSIIFYLDYLLNDYRYIENIIPVTPIPFTIPMDLVESYSSISSTQQLQSIDNLIYKFINYIAKCEQTEMKNIADKPLLSEINRGTNISSLMRKEIQVQIRNMISSEG